jgi:aminoglycoside phosphotransferase (APT) family kinase protein
VIADLGMTDAKCDARFAQLLQAIDPAYRLLGTEPLSGGLATETTALAVGTPGGARHFVVRRHGPRDLANNPDIAAQEFRLLRLLAAERIAVPPPIHLDCRCGIFPTPCLVVGYVEGVTASDAAPPAELADAIADYLATLHRIDGNRTDLAFMPQVEGRLAAIVARTPATPDETLSESRIRTALATALPLVARNNPTVLHGDIWPGNLIWCDGAIAAAIDWEDSAVGDPLADLGNARFELAWSIGAEYADRLTERYHALMPGIALDDLPVWDLHAAIGPTGWVGDWGYDIEIERAMHRRHRLFVDRALAALARRQR